MLGARRRERKSEYMGVREVSNLLHAARIAECVGEPINTMVTVNLTLLGRTSTSVDDIASALAERFRKWVTRPGRKGAAGKPPKARYFWAAENPSHVNLHLAVHVPPERKSDFEAKARRWVVRVVGPVDVPEAVHFRAVDYAPGIAEYLSKGAHPAVSRAYGLKHRPQGWLTGTRSRTSRSLGPTTKKTMREEGTYPHAAGRRIGPKET